MLPNTILSLWFRAVLAVALVAGGLGLTHAWYRRSWTFDRDLNAWLFVPNLGWNEATGLLARILHS